MKLYDELAWVWSVLTPEGTYQEEAHRIIAIAEDALSHSVQSILELGSGGGYLASQFPERAEVVLVDNSLEMLQESRIRNPQREHVRADMLTVDCQRQFDLIVVHDAIMYVPDQKAIQRLLRNICRHMHASSVVCIIPDVIKETFCERALQGGGEEPDRAVLLSEWHWDPDPEDDHIQVEFSLLIRENAQVSSIHESHRMLILSMEEWFALFTEAGLQLNLPCVPWDFGGDFFLLSHQQ